MNTTQSGHDPIADYNRLLQELCDFEASPSSEGVMMQFAQYIVVGSAVPNKFAVGSVGHLYDPTVLPACRYDKAAVKTYSFITGEVTND